MELIEVFTIAFLNLCTIVVTGPKPWASRHGPKPLSDHRIKLHKYSEKQAEAMKHVKPQARDSGILDNYYLKLSSGSRDTLSVSKCSLARVIEDSI